MEINPVTAFEQHVLRARPIGLNRKGKADYSGLLDRVQTTLAARNAQEQFTFDVALWFGYLICHGGDSWKKELCLRLFALLHHGGLIVNRGQQRGWIPWSSQEIPICSAISHTARVLIWLPPDDLAFWSWLWGGHRAETRLAASHGVAAEDDPLQRNMDRYPNITKGVKENKSGSSVNHFGVNLALGGNGQKHPVSGKGIRENGKHGHLYLALSKSAISGRKALLVGTEQSAPIDRQQAKQGWAGPLKSVFTRKIQRWVPDQYGGGHGVGGHSRFSATGGDDFSYKDDPTNLGDYGPARGHYYDGMYLDCNANVFLNVKQQAKQYSPELIAQWGVPPALSRKRAKSSPALLVVPTSGRRRRKSEPGLRIKRGNRLI